MSFWSKRDKANFSLGGARENIKLTISAGQENFSKDKFVLAVYILCLLSVLGQSSLILVSWSKLPGEIPLFYSLPWGEKMLSSPLGLWILPGLVVIFAAINFFVISQVGKNSFLIKTILVFTLIVAFLTIFDTAKIISLLI